MSYQEQKSNVLGLQAIKTEDNVRGIVFFSTTSVLGCVATIASSFSAFAC